MTDSSTSGTKQNGFEIVAIDRGPNVIDDGDPCGRCDAERVAGEGSWIIEYAHGGLKEVCSSCASKLDIGTIDDPKLRADGGTSDNQHCISCGDEIFHGDDIAVLEAGEASKAKNMGHRSLIDSRDPVHGIYDVYPILIHVECLKRSVGTGGNHE